MSPDFDERLQKVRMAVANAEEIPADQESVPDNGAPARVEHPENSKLSNWSDMSEMSIPSKTSVSRFVNPEWNNEENDRFTEITALLQFDEGFDELRAAYVARKRVDTLWVRRQKPD